MWAARLRTLLEQEPCVLVTVAEVHGSAPRAPGSRMLVTPQREAGSIGGGNLEFEAIRTARRLLADTEPGTRSEAIFGLGPNLNQCCGGAVVLLYEHVDQGNLDWLDELAGAQSDGRAAVLVTPIDPQDASRWVLQPGDPTPAGLPGSVVQAIGEIRESPIRVTGTDRRYLVESIQRRRMPLALFGAGHVGRATARVLAELPFDITWLDSRPGQFGDSGFADVRMEECADPAGRVAAFPPDTVYVVMTHSHATDEDICHGVLTRGDFAWLGLIGSATKRRRFAHRLEQRGIPAPLLDKLVCPLGASGVTGKRPATIAVALAAQLLQEVVPEPWK